MKLRIIKIQKTLDFDSLHPNTWQGLPESDLIAAHLLKDQIDNFDPEDPNSFTVEDHGKLVGLSPFNPGTFPPWRQSEAEGLFKQWNAADPDSRNEDSIEQAQNELTTDTEGDLSRMAADNHLGHIRQLRQLSKQASNYDYRKAYNSDQPRGPDGRWISGASLTGEVKEKFEKAKADRQAIKDKAKQDAKEAKAKDKAVAKAKKQARIDRAKESYQKLRDSLKKPEPAKPEKPGKEPENEKPPEPFLEEADKQEEGEKIPPKKELLLDINSKKDEDKPMNTNTKSESTHNIKGNQLEDVAVGGYNLPKEVVSDFVKNNNVPVSENGDVHLTQDQQKQAVKDAYNKQVKSHWMPSGIPGQYVVDPAKAKDYQSGPGARGMTENDANASMAILTQHAGFDSQTKLSVESDGLEWRGPVRAHPFTVSIVRRNSGASKYDRVDAPVNSPKEAKAIGKLIKLGQLKKEQEIARVNAAHRSVDSE